MSILIEIARWSLPAFAALLFLLQALAREVGYALGRRGARGDAPTEGVGVVVTSMLGLLAFVLGLTLAYANTRFQERRQDTLAEAQSIGTSWLRAHAVGQPQGLEDCRPTGRLCPPSPRLHPDAGRGGSVLRPCAHERVAGHDMVSSPEISAGKARPGRYQPADVAE